jgi:hypothetical protein
LKVLAGLALAGEYDVDIEKYVSNFVMLIINNFTLSNARQLYLSIREEQWVKQSPNILIGIFISVT